MAIENIRRKSGSSLHDPPFCFDPLEPREDDDEDMHLLSAIDDRDEVNDGSRGVELTSCLKWSPISGMDSTQKEFLGSASNETDERHQMYAPAQELDDDCGFSFDCEYGKLGGDEVNQGRDTYSLSYNAVKEVSSLPKGGYSKAMNISEAGDIEPYPNFIPKQETSQLSSHHDEGLPNNFSMDQMDFDPDIPSHYTLYDGQHLMDENGITAGPGQGTMPGSLPRVVQTPHGPALLLKASTTALPIPASLSFPNYAANVQQRKFQRWCDNEDAILRYAVSCEDESKPNWKKISKNFFSGSRSPLQCKSRWTKSLQPGIVLGNWKEDEDAKIRQLRQQGVRWAHIAEQLPGRIAEHIRDRYVNFLDPDLKKTPWSKGEDQILFEQQKLHGNKWTLIAKCLPGRSENAVKNRWHNAKMTQRRRMRRHAAERTLESTSLRARKPVAELCSEDDESLDNVEHIVDV